MVVSLCDGRFELLQQRPRVPQSQKYLMSDPLQKKIANLYSICSDFVN